jgi:hypothetical protein
MGGSQPLSRGQIRCGPQHLCLTERGPLLVHVRVCPGAAERALSAEQKLNPGGRVYHGVRTASVVLPCLLYEREFCYLQNLTAAQTP